MKKQKFKRGNLVKVLSGHLIWSSKGGVKDISPEDVGRLAIIDGSYAEKCGGSDTNSYAIIFPDTGGSLAWKQEDELELVNDGGEHLFDEAKVNRDKLSKQNTDINYISERLDDGYLCSESVLFLFNLLGFKTSFLLDGDFFTLFNEWEVLRPIFAHIKNSNTVEEAESVFTKIGLSTLNVSRVWKAFHGGRI